MGNCKKLVFMPSDPLDEYIEKGRSYEWLEQYYNPDDYFDEVFCLSPWGCKSERIGKIRVIKAQIGEFSKIIRDINPLVVRAYGGYRCADWISASKVTGVPTLVSVHDRRPEMIHDSLKYADGIICTSSVVLEQVEKKINLSDKKVWILPNRIDTNIFVPSYNEKAFENLNKRFGTGKHILHVGRKSNEKNLDTLIRSLRYINGDAVLICIGQGNTDKYTQIAVEEKVKDRCFFIDRIEHEQLPIWYSWCDCFCVPSRAEGFGCVFIEAAACGAIVVTSNIAPMNEYFTDRVDSILVSEYENPKSVANAINYALNNDDEILRIRSNARNICYRFDKKNIDKREIDIYKEMMKVSSNNKVNWMYFYKAKIIGIMTYIKNIFKIANT